MIRGVICATVTPFRNGELDIASFSRLLEFLKGKVDGILVCGTTGEFPSLSIDEKKLLIKAALEKEAQNFRIFPHVGGTNLREAKILGNFAKDCGADVLVAVTPYYYRWDFESILQYYKELEKIDLPLLVYEIPNYTGIMLSLEEIRRLIEDVNVIAIKESTTNEGRLRELAQLKEKISLLVGTDSLIDFGLRLGYHGCVSAIANFLPEVIKEIHTSVMSRNFEKASMLQEKIRKVRSFLKEKGPSIRGIKKALELRGLVGGEARCPFVNFTPQEGENFLLELKGLLEKEGLL